MPDYRSVVRERLRAARLRETLMVEIVEEVASHLGDVHQAALADGASEAEATRAALAELDSARPPPPRAAAAAITRGADSALETRRLRDWFPLTRGAPGVASAGCPLRASRSAQPAALHHRRAPDSGAWHRRQFGLVQHRVRGAIATAAVGRCRSSGEDLALGPGEPDAAWAPDLRRIRARCRARDAGRYGGVRAARDPRRGW